MTARPSAFPAALLGPVAVAAASVALVPGFPAWAVTTFAGGLAARLVLLATRREVRSPRLWTALWASAPAAATVYVGAVATGGTGDAGPAFLAAIAMIATLTLLSPPSATGSVRLLALAGILVAGAALAFPAASLAVAVVLFVVSLVPASLALEARSGVGGRDEGEGVARRVSAAPSGRGTARTTAGVMASVLAIGLPLGFLLFAALPVRPEPGRAGERGSPLRANGPTRSAFDATSPSGAGLPSDADVARSTGRFGPRSPFQDSLRPSPRVALTVRVGDGERGPAPLWMRSATFDVFRGSAWERSAEASVAVPIGRRDGAWILGADDGTSEPREPGGRRWTLRVTDWRLDRDGALALLPEASRVSLLEWQDAPDVRLDRDGTVSVAGPYPDAARYAHESAVPSTDRGALAGRRSDAGVAPWPGYAAPPAEAARLRGLARGVVGDARDAAERARRIEAWLRGPEFEYALSDLGLDARRPVADFVLRGRRGHCWCFASAMAAMMRSLGHATRLAVGHRGGDFLESRGEWWFRGSDAHAWCEVWFEGAGWRVYDPTPPDRTGRTGVGGAEPREGTFLDRLARFSPEDRRRFFDGVAGAVDDALGVLAGVPLGWAAAAFGVAALVVATTRRRRATRRIAAGAGTAAPDAPYVRALVALAARGVRRRSAETPDEFLRRAGPAVGPAAPPLSDLTRWHVVARYGGEPLDARAAGAVAAVVAAIRRGPTPATRRAPRGSSGPSR